MATIKDIAQKTGYSLSTVSVVLSGKGEARHIPLRTQTAILDIARSVGYTPNITARRLRGNHIKKMVVVYWASDYRAVLVFRFLQGMHRYLKLKHVDYEVIIHPYNPGSLADSLSASSLASYSACIVCTAAEKDIVFLEKNQFVTPIVLYNRYSEKYSSVIVDNLDIGRSAAKLLRERGKDSSLILAAEKNMTFARERVEGFINEFEGLGGKTTLLEAENNTAASAYECIRDYDFLKNIDSGIFCTSNILAIGILKRLQELAIDKKKSADLISIGTVDNETYLSLFPGFTLIDIPIERMGYKCLELIDQTINGKITKPRSIKVDFSYC